MNRQNLLVGEEIRGDLKALARKVVDEQYRVHPELWERYGDNGYEKCVQDTESHLAYLAEAVASSSESLFVEYVRWAGVLLKTYKVPENDFRANLEATRTVLRERLLSDAVLILNPYLEAGIQELSDPVVSIRSYLAGDVPLADLARRYLDALLNGDCDTAFQMVHNMVAAGTSIRDIYLSVFQPTQYELGRLWQTGETSIALEHFCTAATERLMSQLSPYLSGAQKNGYSIVATCIGGEQHEMGMRMVADFFELEGWQTTYLGANMPLRSLLALLAQRKPDILALSTTITTHLDKVREVISAVRAQPDLAHIKIMVGGYPFNISPLLWREVGADGYAANSDQALQVALKLMQGEPPPLPIGA